MNPISVPFDPAQPAGKAIYPVAELYTFPVFASRAQYASVYGQDPPPYDPNKRDKRWFDSTVDLSDPTAFATYMAWRPKSDGSYKREAIGMPTAEAAVPNIPPDDTKMVSQPPTLRPWEVPARDLLPNEALAPDPFGGLMIQNTDLVVQQQASAGEYTATDRATQESMAADIRAIRAKLGA